MDSGNLKSWEDTCVWQDREAYDAAVRESALCVWQEAEGPDAAVRDWGKRGIYCTYAPNVESIPVIKDEDRERYRKQVKESEGFDFDYFPGMRAITGIIEPLRDGVDPQSYAKRLLPAIEQHNQLKQVEGGTLIELVRIIKINTMYYPIPQRFFTFEARDVPDGPTRTYQARLDSVVGQSAPDVVIFREKSSPAV